jgi:5S rRNA maturation endonuclease (ribonuclease M5)
VSQLLDGLQCDRGGCPCHASARRGRGLTHCPAHEDQHPSLSVTERDRKVLWSCKAGCSQQEVLDALREQGLLHELRDADGGLLARHERKGRWMLPDGRIGLQGASPKDLLYGVEFLRDAAGRNVVLVEGEKAADALRPVGFVAVATVCGAGTTPSLAALEPLRGFSIYLWPDNDDQGRAHMRRIAALLRELGCTVFVIDWSEAPEHGDAADLVAELGMEHARAAVEQLVDDAVEFEAMEPAPNGARGEHEVAESPAWPEPMAREAFYGRAGDVVRTIEPTTESDPVAILMHFLTYFGSCAGLKPYFLVEDTRHGLNEFVGIVGATSKARKGTADKRVRRLFSLVDEEWSKNRLKSGLSSGEGLIWAVRDPMYKLNAKTQVLELEDPGEGDKRLLVVESELATALRRIDRDGSSLSPLLRDAWDRMRLDTLVSERSRGKAKADQNHISVLGHITKAELARYLTRTEAANGLGNRFVWICVKRARLLPRGSTPPNLNPLVTRVHSALVFADALEKPLDFDEVAARIWERIYGPLSEGKPGLLGAIVARGEAHVVRLAEQYAVLDLSPVIRAPHLLAALAVWDFSEASARCIFGDALGDPDQDEVLTAVRGASNGMTAGELRDHFQRHWSADRIRAATAALTEAGLISVETEKTGGRPATRFRAAQAATDRPDGYLGLALGYLGDSAVSAVSVERVDLYSEGPETRLVSSARKVSDAESEIAIREGTADLSAHFPRTFRASDQPDSELGEEIPRLPRTPAEVEADDGYDPEALEALLAANESPPWVEEDEV